MAELKMELMSGIADFRSVLHDLDDCLARLISAEDALQRNVQRLARLESWLNPRRVTQRVRAARAAIAAWLSFKRHPVGR
jgi:hypothetical protein